MPVRPRNTRAPKRTQPTPRRWWQRLLRFAVWTLLLFMLSSALLVLTLRWVNPPTSGVAISRMLQARFEGRTDFRVWQCWRRIEAMGAALPISVIAAEDQRFATHHGFDLVELRNALSESATGQRLRGASTLSQQTAKNLFLWPGRSWVRKGLEAWFTVLIELSWPKRRILEVYLNIVEFGDGLFGACAGARGIFGKEPALLSAEQAARLAATLPNPHVLHAGAPSPAVLERAQWIRVQVRNLGAEAYLRSIGIESSDVIAP